MPSYEGTVQLSAAEIKAIKQMSQQPKVEFYRKLSLRSLKMEWRWRVTAANGKRIGASTEGYINKADASMNVIHLGHALVNSKING